MADKPSPKGSEERAKLGAGSDAKSMQKVIDSQPEGLSEEPDRGADSASESERVREREREGEKMKSQRDV